MDASLVNQGSENKPCVLGNLFNEGNFECIDFLDLAIRLSTGLILSFFLFDMPLGTIKKWFSLGNEASGPESDGPKSSEKLRSLPPSFDEERISHERGQIVLFDSILENLESLPLVLFPEAEARIARYKALKEERLALIAQLEAKVARRKAHFGTISFQQPTTHIEQKEPVSVPPSTDDFLLDDDFGQSPDMVSYGVHGQVQAAYEGDQAE
jgi:hypothetical protein